MKKVKLILACFMALATVALFADVSVEANADGVTADVTISTKNLGASQIVVAGTMNGWDPAGIPMTKDDAGIWTLKLNFKLGEVFKYKFLIDGAWTFDKKSPASEDDGFGGLNGVVDIKKILAKAGAPVETPAGGEAVAEVVEMKPLSYSTWTLAYLDAKAITKDVATKEKNGLEMDTLSLTAKSYWKIVGDILPGVNFFTEMQVCQGSVSLWQSNTQWDDTPFVTAADGLQNMVEAIFHPFFVFNDSGIGPMVGHWKVKLITDYVEVFTGYKYAKGSGHAFFYNTVDNGTDAGPGFVEFILGKKLQTLGENMSLEAVVGPNKRAGYGLYSWATLTFGDYAADIGYNVKSNSATPFAFFKDYNSMISLGGSAKFGDISAKIQALTNFGIKDAKFLDSSALKLNVNFNQPMFAVDFTYQLAGKSAVTLYGGDTPVQDKNQITLNPSVKLDSIGAKAYVDTQYTMAATFADIGKNDVNFYFKPGFFIDLSKFTDLKISSDTYTKINLDAFQVGIAKGKTGLKVPMTAEKVVFTDLAAFMPNLTVYYCMDINYGDVKKTGLYPALTAYHTLLAQAKLLNDMGATFGVAVNGNTPFNDADVAKTASPFGIAMGWNMTLPIDKKPILYANVTYNLDPYDSSQEIFDFGDNGYYRQDTMDAGYGEAHFRTGIKWSF